MRQKLFSLFPDRMGYTKKDRGDKKEERSMHNVVDVGIHSPERGEYYFPPYEGRKSVMKIWSVEVKEML